MTRTPAGGDEEPEHGEPDTPGTDPAGNEPVAASSTVQGTTGGGSVENEPADADPAVDGEPVDPEPADVEPAAVEVVDAEPVDVEPVDVEPVDVESAVVEPVDVEPVDVEPVDVEPADVEAAAVEPVDAEPRVVEFAAVEPLDAEPVDAAFADVEPVDAEFAAVESLDVEPADAGFAAAGFADAEPMDVEPVDVEPVAVEPVDAEPRGVEFADTEPADVDPLDTAPAGTGPAGLFAEPETENEPEYLALVEEMTRANEEREDAPAPVTPGGVGRAEAAVTGPSARRRLFEAMQPKATRSQAVVFLLCAVLGFTLFVSVRQTQERGLSSMRQSDLFSLLAGVNERSSRLEDESRRLQEVADGLRSGSDRAEAAQRAAQQRLDELGILAGTAPAQGPGIQLVISDPEQQVEAATLLDVVEELRDAGGEAIQVGTARVVADTAFVDDTGGIAVGGSVQHFPLTLLVIGDPQTLTAALNIPGGVLDNLRQDGATGIVTQKDTVNITALLPTKAPQYARPAPSANS